MKALLHYFENSGGPGAGGGGSPGFFGDGLDFGGGAAPPGGQRNLAQQNAGTGRPPAAASPFTLNLGGITVNGTFEGAPFANGGHGVIITANPLGCDICRWSQVVTRTGGSPFTDRQGGYPGAPLYPPADWPLSKFNDMPGFNPGTSGSFSAITILGISSFEQRTFQVKGAFTYGFSVSKNGSLTTKSPRIAGATQLRNALRVLRAQSPTWTIQ